MDSRNQKYREDIYVPGSSYRNSLNDPGSIAPMDMMDAENLSTEQAAPPSAQGDSYYISTRRQIYALKPEGGSTYQNYSTSHSDAPQLSPGFVQCPALSGDRTPYYTPGNQVVVKAATGDVSSYQICSPTTSPPQGIAMESSPIPLQRSEQLGKEASSKKELRLMKNRQAARECRRRKKEYINRLEARIVALELQNKKLMEEIEYFKGICAERSS